MMLVEALTTHGTALARLNQTQLAKSTLDQAVAIAQNAGNPDRGGIAAITAIEELSGIFQSMPYSITTPLPSHCFRIRRIASITTRLGECARRVLAAEFASVRAGVKEAERSDGSRIFARCRGAPI